MNDLPHELIRDIFGHVIGECLGWHKQIVLVCGYWRDIACAIQAVARSRSLCWMMSAACSDRRAAIDLIMQVPPYPVTEVTAVIDEYADIIHSVAIDVATRQCQWVSNHEEHFSIHVDIFAREIQVKCGSATTLASHGKYSWAVRFGKKVNVKGLFIEFIVADVINVLQKTYSGVHAYD